MAAEQGATKEGQKLPQKEWAQDAQEEDAQEAVQDVIIQQEPIWLPAKPKLKQLPIASA